MPFDGDLVTRPLLAAAFELSTKQAVATGVLAAWLWLVRRRHRPLLRDVSDAQLALFDLARTDLPPFAEPDKGPGSAQAARAAISSPNTRPGA